MASWRQVAAVTEEHSVFNVVKTKFGSHFIDLLRRNACFSELKPRVSLPTTTIQHATSRSSDGLELVSPSSLDPTGLSIQRSTCGGMCSQQRDAIVSTWSQKLWGMFPSFEDQKKGEAGPVTDNYRPMEINSSHSRINKKTPMKTFNRKMHRCYFNKHSKTQKQSLTGSAFSPQTLRFYRTDSFKFTVPFLEHVEAESLVEVVSLVSLWVCVHTLTVWSPEAECPCRCAFA